MEGNQGTEGGGYNTPAGEKSAGIEKEEMLLGEGKREQRKKRQTDKERECHWEIISPIDRNITISHTLLSECPSHIPPD